MASRRRRKNITPAQWESLGIPREFLETIVDVYKTPDDIRRLHDETARLCSEAESAAERLQRNLISLSEIMGDDWPEKDLVRMADADPSLGLPAAACCNYPALLLALQEILEPLGENNALLRSQLMEDPAGFRVQTRALAWLVLAVENLGMTRYQASLDVAEYMSQYTDSIPDGRALAERINRLEREHEPEFTRMKSFLARGYPSTKTLLLMIMYGAFPVPNSLKPIVRAN